MHELIKRIEDKVRNCNDNNKEERARKGAYVDCLVMLKQLVNPDGVNALLGERVRNVTVDDLIFIQKSIQDNLKSWNYKNEPDLLRSYKIIDKYLKAEHVA